MDTFRYRGLFLMTYLKWVRFYEFCRRFIWRFKDLCPIVLTEVAKMKRVLMLGMLVVGGCRTMESVKSDTDGGTVKTYAGKAVELLLWAEEVLKENGAESFERDPAKAAVFCNFPANFAHNGTYAGVWVTEEGPGKVRVRCVTLRRMAHQVGCALSEKSFHELLAAKVGK